MLCQTVDALLPVLDLLQQPAFCIREDGSTACNQAAAHLAPPNRETLTDWLGANAAAYEKWNRNSVLELSIDTAGIGNSLTVQTLIDGELFLLKPCESLSASANTMQVAAQVLRQPLTDLSVFSQYLETSLEKLKHPELLAQSASITRQIYRLSRITGNLADLERLRSGSYHPRLEKLNARGFLAELLLEAGDLCRLAGKTLSYKLPEASVAILGDKTLLERALLNLLSNALKFGKADLPVEFWTETTAGHLMLRMRNTCTDNRLELLHGAFHRLEHRGPLPDPRWGVGLGLPLSQSIAQLHGGMVAVEVGSNNTATVTLSISRRRPLGSVRLETPPPFDYTGGMRPTMVELSDVLPDKLFQSDAL